MRRKLKVTDVWLNWFYSEGIQIVTTIDNREMFTKTFEGNIHGNHLNYSMVFSLIESVINTYSFLKVDSIRLAWSEKLEKDNLQLFRQSCSFKNWKQNVLKGNYEFENSYGEFYEDSTDINFNYEVDVKGKRLSLYKYGQADSVTIYLWYNPKTNSTNYQVSLGLRKALFAIDENFEMQLPANYLESNKILLLEMDKKLKDKIKVV